MTYVYDSNGNIVSKTPYTNVTSSDLSTATQGTAIVYGYGDSNWSDKLIWNFDYAMGCLWLVWSTGTSAVDDFEV